jgi:hypothetical protein
MSEKNQTTAAVRHSRSLSFTVQGPAPGRQTNRLSAARNRPQNYSRIEGKDLPYCTPAGKVCKIQFPAKRF